MSPHDHLAVSLRPVSAFARPLLARAVATLPKLPPDARAAPLTAIDAFVAAPSAARFLTAMAALTQARHAALVGRGLLTTASRARTHALHDLRAALPADPATVDRLERDLPLDARCGARLSALAALLCTYDELAGRVQADTERWRERLGARPRRSRRPGDPGPRRR